MADEVVIPPIYSTTRVQVVAIVDSLAGLKARVKLVGITPETFIELNVQDVEFTPEKGKEYFLVMTPTEQLPPL